MSTLLSRSICEEAPSLAYIRRYEQALLGARQGFESDSCFANEMLLKVCATAAQLWVNMRGLEEEQLTDQSDFDTYQFYTAVAHGISELGHLHHQVSASTLGDVVDYCLSIGFAPLSSTQPHLTWSQRWIEPPWWSSILTSCAWEQLVYITELRREATGRVTREITGLLRSRLPGWQHHIAMLPNRPTPKRLKELHKLEALLRPATQAHPI